MLKTCHAWLLGKKDKVITILKYIIFAYLRSVLIIIKQNSDFMCFSSIFDWKIQFSLYLFSKDVRHFGHHKK